MIAFFSFSDNTIGFLIDGALDTKTSRNLKKQVIDRIKKHSKVSLYIEDASITEFKIHCVISQCIFKIKNAKNIKKYALVSDKRWIHINAFISNLILSTKVKSFSIDDRLKAISWIAEEDKK